MKRKYTKDLLIAFKKLCDTLPWQSAKQHYALGIAIVAEAGIEFHDFEHVARSPLFGEIASAFHEMCERKWIEKIEIDEQIKKDLFFEYKELITKVCGFYSDTKQMRKILSKEWPLGDHWFKLTIEGESIVEKITSPTWKKVRVVIKDNAKPIVITIIGVLIARFLLFFIKWLISI